MNIQMDELHGNGICDTIFFGFTSNVWQNLYFVFG
jgi:hypothetical protein